MTAFWKGFRRGTVLAWRIGGPALVAAAFVFAARDLAPAWACIVMAAVGAIGCMIADVLSVSGGTP